jgi:hypothetical protein
MTTEITTVTDAEILDLARRANATGQLELAWSLQSAVYGTGTGAPHEAATISRAADRKRAAQVVRWARGEAVDAPSQQTQDEIRHMLRHEQARA